MILLKSRKEGSGDDLLPLREKVPRGGGRGRPPRDLAIRLGTSRLPIRRPGAGPPLIRPSAPFSLKERKISRRELFQHLDKADQNESELTISPPARVPTAHQVGIATVSLKNRTEPSAMQALTPPE